MKKKLIKRIRIAIIGLMLILIWTVILSNFFSPSFLLVYFIVLITISQCSLIEFVIAKIAKEK